MRDSVGGFSDGWGSAGVFVERDASLSLSRVVCLRNETFGVAATLGGAIVLSDVAVWDTLPSACAFATCADQPAGIGAAGYRGGRLGFSRFSIARAHLCGVQVAREGELDLADGEVAESAIGVCLQVEGYDVGRLTDAVRYRDNGATIEATTFPVPDADRSNRAIEGAQRARLGERGEVHANDGRRLLDGCMPGGPWAGSPDSRRRGRAGSR
ncbi:MAG: hypothetical protein M5U28_49210 [Sandaracinaceae bacterium]|nr:hypothetical protein [Sandaracinaceae bacterium]